MKYYTKNGILEVKRISLIFGGLSWWSTYLLSNEDKDIKSPGVPGGSVALEQDLLVGAVLIDPHSDASEPLNFIKA